MEFDPASKDLFADSGQFIKRLSCPLHGGRQHLIEMSDSPHSICTNCQRTVLDTSVMNDDEVLAAVRADSSTCLSLSTTQVNIRVVTGPSNKSLRSVKENKSSILIRPFNVARLLARPRVERLVYELRVRYEHILYSYRRNR